MLLFLFVSFVFSSKECDQRTSIYKSHGKSNANSWYFDSKTYTSSTDRMNIDQYRRHINKTVKCTGKWCIDNEWKCKVGNSRDCYNVEHIIPTANKIKAILNCSLDIHGNLVMSYGAWNQALSNGYYGEKAVIYGNKIVKTAYDSVYEACFNKTTKNYPIELCLKIKK